MKKILLVLALVASAVNTQAAVVFSESFSYGDGPVAIVGAPGSPWANNSGTAGSMQVFNNQLEVSISRSEDIIAPLNGGPYGTNVPTTAVYSSFTVNFISRPTQTGAYFAHFVGTSAGSFRARVWASITNVAGGSNVGASFFRLGVGNSSGSSATSGQLAMDLATNVTYTVVTRFEIATATSTIWINPTAETDPSATATDVVDPSTYVDIASYGFRQASGEGVARIDNFRVGTTFNDVAGDNTSPTISSISDQNTPANTPTAAIPFQIADLETEASNLVVDATSSNTTLVPNGNIVLGGTDENRTITVTPATDEQGSTVISVTVSDGANTTTNQFALSVGAPNVSDITSQITDTNTAVGPIPFTVSDGESAPGSLTPSAASSDTNLIPVENIVFGGSGANRTVTVIPAADQTGVATITVTISDGTQTASDSFKVTVRRNLGLLFSDDFNRADGLLVDGSGTWIHNPGTSLEMSIVNNRLQMAQNQAEDVYTELPGFAPSSGNGSTTNGSVLYAKMTIDLSVLPSTAGEYFAHFRDDATQFRSKLFVSRTNAASGFYRVGIANSANVVTPASQVATDLATNTTYTVVVRYNVGTGESKLWLNPSAETDAGVSATDSPSLASISSWAFRQASGIGTNFVDDLKIGGAFSDVVNVVAPPPSLSIQQDGVNVILSWSNPTFTLQAAPLVTGTYTNVVGATSPHTNALTGTQQYFRLMQ